MGSLGAPTSWRPPLLALITLLAVGLRLDEGGAAAGRAARRRPRRPSSRSPSGPRAPTAPRSEATLTCDPPVGRIRPGGRVRRARRRPEALEPVPPGTACTMIFGGPEQATVVGTLERQGGRRGLRALERLRARPLGPHGSSPPTRGLTPARARAHNETVRLALTAALAAARARVGGGRGAASPRWPAARSSRPRASGTSRWARCRSTSAQPRSSRRSARASTCRRLRLGRVGRRPDRDPGHGRRRLPADLRRSTSTTTTRAIRALPDPARRRDRGRARRRRRPARDHRRPGLLHALRTVRPLAGALGRGLRGDLGSRVERSPACVAGPRRTPPACRSCPGSPATTR